MLASDMVGALRSTPCGERLHAALSTQGNAFLVGGAVRDLLLGRVPHEADVVVVGDPAGLLAALGGEVLTHERFGTAMVAVDGYTYDVARARTESYATPGALPDVSPASLAEDLRRRDLSINAIAMDADGTLTAVDGALQDLRDGTLRVLHDRSFLDDPTRLWRMARYGARLGFSVDHHTAALADAAVQGGALRTVSGPRLGAELRLALNEPDPSAVLRRAHTGGLLPDGVHPPDAAMLRAAQTLLPPEGRGDLLVLAAWAAATEPGALHRWLDELSFLAVDRDTVLAAADAAGRLSFDGSSSVIAAGLRGEPIEAVALAGAHSDPEAARRWLQELRHVRPQIDGDDLIAAGVAPGPGLGARLDRVLAAKLDGLAPTREDELQIALADDEQVSE